MLALMAGSIMYPELILRSSVSIATSLVTSVNYLISISHNDLDLHNLLISSDIVTDINIIKNFIEEKQHSNHSETVRVCIENLSNTLSELENNIKNITTKIEEHNKLWFYRFRSYNITKEKASIPILIDQMRHRFDLLIKISSNLS
jgi:phenylalanyl-tRNA synthetase alpha subunit